MTYYALSPDSDYEMWQMALDSSRQKNIGKRDSAFSIPELKCQVIEYSQVQKNNTKRESGWGRGALIFRRKKMQEPFRNSVRQKDDMKPVPRCRPTNITRHRTKFSRPGRPGA